MGNENLPKTLVEAIKYFSDIDLCIDFVSELRWPDGVTCPYCESSQVGFISTRRIWKCKRCRKQFSVKVGTIFEDSPIGLDKWLAGMWLIANAKNGISSYEVHRALGVTQKTAWFMLHRIRLAMQTGTFGKLSGEVEADETFIGGKGRFMHADKKEQKIQGRGIVGKAVVLGLLERNSEDDCSMVRTKIIPNIRRKTVLPVIRKHVALGSQVFTDALSSYAGLELDYIHEMVDHAEEYVRGNVHTNGLENFWSILKRCIKGTYVSIDVEHLFRYLDEEVFRFNNRKGKDADRFHSVTKSVVGKRLTYKELTGKIDS